MIKIPTIAGFLLIALLLNYCEAFSMQERHRYDFLNETYKPYCIEDNLIGDEQKNGLQLRKVRRAELNSWVPNFSDHFVASIILLCNNKPENINEFIHNTIKYGLTYSSPFIFGIVLLIVLAGMWTYSVFWKKQPKSYNKIIGQQLTHKTQIGLSVFVLALLLAAAVSIYGISESGRIEKTLNKFWCHIQQQDIGFLRSNKNQSGRLIDLSFSINNFTNFLTERYSSIRQILEQMKKDKIITKTYELQTNFYSTLLAIQNETQQLSNLTAYSENISRLLSQLFYGQLSDIIFFNDTLEYERQVLIGFTFIKGNFDKYGNKFFGFGGISKLVSTTVQIFFFIALVSAIGSLLVIGYIISKQKFSEIYYKYIVQYILGAICGVCLICAILNSSLGMFLHVFQDGTDYLLVGNRPRQHFLAAGSLNDPLIDIMSSYWPQAPGNMSLYANASLVTDLAHFEEKYSEFRQLSIENQIKINNQNTKNITNKDLSDIQKYKKYLSKINKEVKTIRVQMISPEGLGKLDPTAFGRNAYNYLHTLSIHGFNRCYEYRKIYGFLSLFLMIAIISSMFIGFSYQSYMKTGQTDTQHHLDEQSQSDQPYKIHLQQEMRLSEH